MRQRDISSAQKKLKHKLHKWQEKHTGIKWIQVTLQCVHAWVYHSAKPIMRLVVWSPLLVQYAVIVWMPLPVNNIEVHQSLGGIVWKTEETAKKEKKTDKLVKAEDCKFENEKSTGLWSDRAPSSTLLCMSVQTGISVCLQCELYI